MLKVANSVSELIGQTPLLKINKLTGEDWATVYAKLEWYNVGGSVKDRIALYLIEYAEAMGALSKEKTILEATSGNTGIALAMIAAAKGYRIELVMPPRSKMFHLTVHSVVRYDPLLPLYRTSTEHT